MFLLIDTSNSMKFLTDVKLTKWEAVRIALKTFFASEQSRASRIAIRRFPDQAPSIQPDSCMADADCNDAECRFARRCPNKKTCNSPADCDGAECRTFGRCGGGTGAICFLDDDCTDQPCVPNPGFCNPGGTCSMASYAQPTLPLTAMQDGAVSFVLEQTVPSGATPSVPAFLGFRPLATQSAGAGGRNKTILLLVTDGVPSECGPGLPLDIKAAYSLMAADAETAAKLDVPTFVLAIYTDEEATQGAAGLGKIAEAGGTESPFVVAPDGALTGSFLSALTEIREGATACNFSLPDVAPKQVRPAGVTVEVLGQSLRHVAGPAACDARGFYLDSDISTAASASRVILCPDTCSKLTPDDVVHVAASCD